jgi:hypothetical protein
MSVLAEDVVLANYGDVYTVDATITGTPHKLEASVKSPPDVINCLAIVKLDSEELAALGMKNGWASIFGEAAE